MAMAFAPAAIHYPTIQIDEPQVVSKSYPGYWDDLRKAGFGVTRLEAFGMHDEMHFLRVVLPRRKVNSLVRLCKKLSPKSFLTIEDVRSAHGGYLP